MIGTIRPSWNNLKCLGLRDHITQTMCRACGSLATERANFSRALLSYDTIFLSLFSSDSNFTEQKIRARPFRCGTQFKQQSIDGKYLANVSVLTAATKIQDDITDGQKKLPSFVYKRVKNEQKLASEKLAALGLPINKISLALDEYSKIEVSQERAPFEELAAPIALCYELIFRCLPSSLPLSCDQMALVGSSFGRLTLLVDAIEDSDEDIKTGAYNIWHAATDLPEDKTALRSIIFHEFNELKKSANKLSEIASQYIEASRDAVMSRLSTPLKPRTLMTHPMSLLASCSCIQQNCDGSSELTGTGMCFAAIFGFGCICCCSKACD